jgi:hypothetical protein
MVLAMALLAVSLSGTAWAQEPAKPASTPQDRPERYLRLDLFVGGAAHQVKDPPKNENGEVEPGWGEIGWETGATLSVAVPWVGIAGTIGNYNIENVPAYHLLVGPHFTTTWLDADIMAVRVFAHALSGFARTSGSAPPQTSGEFVLSVGIDIMPLFLRIQRDQVWLNLDGLPNTYSRIFAGAVIPLCFRACRSTDMIDVSGRPRVK